ncbi:MAG: hypothetical protein IKU82_05845, partial [Clostridia bacterium]|nr:hypothetical protein [Clostridia bacterium]
MKGFKRMVVGILILSLFMNIRIDALAMNTGFSTENLSEDTKDLFLKNVNLSILYEEPEKSNIECFDVNNSQLIAIGQNRKDRKTICIYSKNGIFQYGYAFNCSGSFGVEWDNENLNIFFVRSSVIASVTPEGEIIDVLLVQDTIENNSYKNHFIDATKRIVDNMEYSMVNNLGLLNFLASSHSKII